MKSGTPAFFAAVAMAFLFVGTATAQDDPATVERTARAYLAAYESVDVERMMELAAEDIVFRDDAHQPVLRGDLTSSKAGMHGCRLSKDL